MDAKFGVNNHQPLSTIQAGNTRHLDRWFCKKNLSPKKVPTITRAPSYPWEPNKHGS
jgi:hypothetical protein